MLSRLCFWLFSLLAIGSMASAEEFGRYQPEPMYAESVSESFYVTLRDGVNLAVSITRPAVNGAAVTEPLPVIWHHSLSMSREMRDGTGGFISALRAMPTLAQHGYVIAQVARRGNGQSSGVMRGYHDRNEAHDAYEMTQWFAEQPWSNGNVGIYGCSNTGDAAMHAMSVRPPALKAVFAGCFSWHKFDAFRRGGIFAQWGTGPSRKLEDDLALPPVDTDPTKTLLAKASAEHQLATPLIEMWKTLPYRDSWSPAVGSRFWAEGSVASYQDQIKRSGIPLYVMGGWFDELRDQGLITFMNVPNTHVVMGPWQHCRNGDFPLLNEIQRFFDGYLKGINSGIRESKKVNYFTMTSMDDGHWQGSDQWPVEATRYQNLYFKQDNLSPQRPSKKTVNVLEVVPEEQCEGEVISSRSQPCAAHPASLSYSAQASSKPLQITGHPVLEMWVSANTEDGNIFAFLEDVAPDGNVTVVTEGRLKMSQRKEHKAPWALPSDIPWHRNYEEDTQPLAAGEVVQLRFDLMPTSWVVQPGHKLRVTVTGSDYRQRLRDSNQKQPTFKIFSEGKQPSFIRLPILETGETGVR